MTTTLLAAARRTRRMVSREAELRQLQEAIYRNDGTLQIVLLTGRGGIGKSRLVEEVLQWGATPPVAGENSLPLISNLIEMADLRLHTRNQFLQEIRNGLSGFQRADFRHYDSAYRDLQRLRRVQGFGISQAEEKAEKSFREDYRANTKQRRFVIAVDTIERLEVSGFEWFEEYNLLTLDDLKASTLRWLVEQIRNEDGLPNTTLILAGRDQEGAQIIRIIKEAARQNKRAVVTELPLQFFNLEEIKSYFTQLDVDWKQRRAANPSDQRTANIADAMERLANNENQAQVLELYTAGQPVRLALYTDIIVDGRTIPAQLRQHYADAVQSLTGPDGQIDSERLNNERQVIEREFINVLFDRPGRQADMLKALVRTERELNAEQLHFVLNDPVPDATNSWQLEQAQLRQIQTDLDEMQHLSIVKTITKEQREQFITLQDEIYRIYAGVILMREGDRQDENLARKELYRRLEEWAARRLDHENSIREQFQREDESKLRLDSPAMALLVRFPILSDPAERQRIQNLERIAALEVERMYYALLFDPLRNFNATYCSLADRRWFAADEDGNAIAQAEAWRVLTRHEAIRFVDMSLPRHQTTDLALVALRRAALQENVVRWIKIFTMRQEYDRAIDFADKAEAIIETFSKEERHSWQHTFSSAERACWREYARILKGTNIDAALKTAQSYVDMLVSLAEHEQDEAVFPERNENGFRGHPAESRLQRTIASMYNTIGYGYVNLGLFRDAVHTYGLALRYARTADFRALQATIRNNLSRALSELGRTERGRRVCMDGLDLRRREGEVVPIALSINTLALIDNDAVRPDLAWVEAATAYAYFQLAQDQRGQGLALIQIGEALRRLANLSYAGRFLVDPPERIADEARNALHSALAIFESGSGASEQLRRIEAWNELGCLHRDALRGKNRSDSPEVWLRNYQDAIYYLSQAVDLARQLKLKRLEIDAAVNVAWTHYYAREYDRIESTLEAVEKLMPEDAFLRPGKVPPDPERDDSYIYHYLSKMYSLRGRLTLDRFQERTNALYSLYPEDRLSRRATVHADSQAQDILRTAAEHFVCCLSYAQIFSPRSSSLIIAYDNVYEYLKIFNAQELDDFAQYVQEARAQYRSAALKIQDFSDLHVFVSECFGIPVTESHTDGTD